MKKQKLINLFKIGVLIFGISFLLTNCDKNNVPEEDIAEPEKLDISITSTSFSKADQALNGLREKYGIDNHIGLWSSGNTQGKTSTDKSGIVIYPDMVKKITRGDYTSYTMLIESLDDDPNTYYNLTVEEIGDSKGMFVTQYKNLSAKASAKTSLASKTSSSHTSISTKRIDDLIEPINKEDFNGSGGGSGGGGSTTYPTDCDGWVTSTTVAIETPCGCGHSWQQLLNNTCKGCQTGYPTWPSLETTTVYECIPSSIDDTSNTGPSSPNTGGVGSLPPNEDEDGNELGGGSITTPVSPDDSSINVVVSNLDRELNLSARQIEWLNNNLLRAEQFLGFLIINSYSKEAKTETKMRISAEMVNDTDPTTPQWDFSKIGTYLNRTALKYKATADVPDTFGTEKMYLLENGLVLYVADGEKKINADGVSLPSTELSDEGYHYIYSYDTKKYYEYRLPPATYVNADIDFLLDAFWTGTKIVARYATPIEDAIILIDGKDFDGVEQGKVQTAGFMIVGFIPGGKILKPISKVVKNSDVALAGWKVIVKIGDDTVKLSFKVVNGFVDFGSRSKLATIIKTTALEEAHHILPWNKLSDPVIQEAAYAGFHMNAKINGRALQKFSSLTGDGIHGNHPAYDKYVQKRLDDFSNGIFDSDSAKDFLDNTLIPKLNEFIDLATDSGLNLNEYFKQVVNPPLGIN